MGNSPSVALVPPSSARRCAYRVESQSSGRLSHVLMRRFAVGIKKSLSRAKERHKEPSLRVGMDSPGSLSVRSELGVHERNRFRDAFYRRSMLRSNRVD